MPLVEKRKIFHELKEKLDLDDQTNLSEKEKVFVDGLRQKGCVTEIPLRLPDDDFRRNFKRIEVIDELLSENYH